MATTLIFCPQCSEWKPAENGRVNQAKNKGLPLYCGRVCAGLARRIPVIPLEEKKLLKREYDMQYRTKNKKWISRKRSAYFQNTYDPEKARKVRKERMPMHVEYCRRPEYKAWKGQYDRKHRAKKQFGEEFADAFLLLQQVEKEIEVRIDRNEIYRQNGTQCKSAKRRREYERITNQSPRSSTRKT